MKHIKEYKEAGFEGNDASLEESLFVYGLIWAKIPNDDSEEYHFIYGISVDDNQEYNLFDWSDMTKKDFCDMIDDWMDVEAIESFAGTPIEEIKNGFPRTIDILISYYGREEIFGSTYQAGFEIAGNN